MQHDLSCPACSRPFTQTAATLRCPEGHDYTPIGLALATNRKTVQALWAAVRALEEDGAGLDYLAKQHPEMRGEERLREAREARDAAQRLREHASAAQKRLDTFIDDAELQPGQ